MKDLHLLKNEESLPRMELSLDNLQRLSNKILDLYQKDDPFTVKCMSKYDGVTSQKHLCPSKNSKQFLSNKNLQRSINIILNIIITTV